MNKQTNNQANKIIYIKPVGIQYMVALVEGNGFCVKADSLLKVSSLTGCVALPHLNIYIMISIAIIVIIVVIILILMIKLLDHLFKKERLVGLCRGRRRGHLAPRLKI